MLWRCNTTGRSSTNPRWPGTSRSETAGSDTGNPLCVYGYAVQAREGIARVLQRKIDRGDVDLSLAKEIAQAIMLDNGVEFHGLG